MQKSGAVEILNQGRISRIHLPEGWSPMAATEDTGAAYVQKWQRAEAPEAMLSFFYRGHPVTDLAATCFVGVLASDPHELSQTEFEDLGDATGNCAYKNAFELRRAHTALLNERMVLCIEGFWLNSSICSHQIFIDASGDGRIIQEIHFVAPPESYAKYLPEIRQALDTIVWAV